MPGPATPVRRRTAGGRRVVVLALTAALLASSACAGGADGEDPAGAVTTDGATGAGRTAVPPLRPEVDDWPESRVRLDGAAELVVKVADTPLRRARGLMRVEHLPDGVGMLFLHERPTSGGYWMRNTLVPLDIAYLRDGEVVAARQMDPCEADPCPVHDAGTEFDAALEVAQGQLEDLGVTEGSTVTWTEPVEVAGR